MQTLLLERQLTKIFNDSILRYSHRRNFYVDDCLKSVPSESEAICLTADLRRLLERGGFNLTKGISNSYKLIESLPESDRAGSFKDLHDSQMPVERALGVRWDVEGDIFC